MKQLPETKQLPANPYSSIGRIDVLLDDLFHHLDKTANPELAQLVERIENEWSVLDEAMSRFQAAITVQMFKEAVAAGRQEDVDRITVNRSDVNDLLSNSVAAVSGWAQILAESGECSKDRDVARKIFNLIQNDWQPKFRALFGEPARQHQQYVEKA